jgi:hypothetical protein
MTAHSPRIPPTVGGNPGRNVRTVNRQEQRVLREIEKNLTVEDPVLAELLRSSGKSRRSRIHRYVGWLAVLFAVLGFASGDVVVLLTAALLASGAVLAWAAPLRDR